MAYYFIKAKYDDDVHGLAHAIFVEKLLDNIQESFGIRTDDWFALKDSDQFQVLEQFVAARDYFENSDLYSS